VKLSVAMIVKNEEAMLAQCLDSVKEADEIVIVDTGSEDKTIEIATQYSNKIFTDYKWEDHFANARNHVLAKCTGDWVLSIDADNILEEGGIQKIRDLIAKYPNERAFNLHFVAHNGTMQHVIPYLYKNCKEVYWKGAVHNYISVQAPITSDITVYYGYSPAHKKDPDRALRMLKKEVDKHHNARETYYLAREYRYRQKWSTCLFWCDEYLKKGFWGPERADTFLMKARCLWQLQRGEEARSACLEALKINTNFKEAVLFMAEMSGPINRNNWLFLAEIADNSNVLFVRTKAEKPASYYEELNDTEPRYTFIYEEVGKRVGVDKALDIGCGQGALNPYILNYDGFDMVKNPFRVADIYTEEYGDYDVYIMLEVLEHLLKDIEVLQKIPVGKKVIFSVPSFDCPPHVRVFTEQIVRWRYRDVIRLEKVTRFNFDKNERKWKRDIEDTLSYILLCEGTRI